MITADPVDFVGTTGETAVFTVGAAGGQLTYQWQYSTDGGKTWKASASTTASASCAITAARDGRLYRCVVTDGNGDSVTSAAAKIVYVAAPARIVNSPADVVGKSGTIAAFTVSAEGDGLTYQWEYSDDGGATWNRSASTSFVATCKVTNERSGRLYRCTVTDRYGRSDTSESAKLLCKKALRITTQPEDCTGAVGTSAVFTVKATGTGVSYLWQYSDNGGRTWKNSASTGDTATCKVTAARDGRLYRCIVSDGTEDQVITRAAVIHVAQPDITITAQPRSFTGAIGDTAVFTVTAEGEGLSYQWQYSDNGGQTWKNSTATNETAACKLTAARDGRLYRCVITDASGTGITSETAKITVI